jgi:hypothetical protein
VAELPEPQPAVEPKPEPNHTVQPEPEPEPVPTVTGAGPTAPSDEPDDDGYEGRHHARTEQAMQHSDPAPAPTGNPGQSQYGDYVWDPYQQKWVPQGQQIPTAPQPAWGSYEQWQHQQATADATAYTWQGENGELYAWDGQRWVLQGQARAQPAPEHSGQPVQHQSPEHTWDGPNGERYVWNGQEWVLTDPGSAPPQQQVNSRGELIYTWQGPDGQVYVWDADLEQWLPQGHQAP